MIKDENFVNIQGWMCSKLHLKGNSLLVYAIIYGFSQDGNSSFHGSLSYLEEWTNSTRQSIINVLKDLVDSGLIIKTISTPNNQYKVNLVYIEELTGSKESLGRSKETLLKNDEMSKETLHNNIEENSINNIDIEASTIISRSQEQEKQKTIAEPTAEWSTPKSLDNSKDLPHNTENNPYVFLSENDREYLRNKYGKCYIPTIKALNEWNRQNPEYRYAAGKDGFERFVQKQGLRRPREDGLSEGSVIARIQFTFQFVCYILKLRWYND